MENVRPVRARTKDVKGEYLNNGSIVCFVEKEISQ